MNRRVTRITSRSLAVVGLGLFAALGCGSDEDPMAAAKDAADAAGEVAGDVGAGAAAAARDVGAGAGTAARDVGAEAGAAASDLGDTAGNTLRDAMPDAESATARCLSLAAKSEWGDALAPCSEAANANPDDLRIKHAMQQAQAAADEG